jgi:uncharacterized protein YbjT (DUF2867 family)
MDSSTGPATPTKRVFQIGAAGGVGRLLAARLVADGHLVSGMHRAPEQGDAVRATGARPVVGDLIGDAAQTLAERMAGHDAVVFSAGAHGTGLDLTTAIDGRGVEKAIAACGIAGIRRFVLVSVFMDAGRARERSEGFEHYMAVKRSADVALAASDLDWVILRPGALANSPGTGRVALGPAIAYGSVPREDVAWVIAVLLFHPEINRVCLELTGGEQLIANALAAVVPRRAEV